MGKVFKRTEHCTCSQKAQRQGKVLVGIFCNLKFLKKGTLHYEFGERGT